MPVHIRHKVCDFKIYFYGDADGFGTFESYRAIASGAILAGRPRCVEIHGLLGRLEPGDTDELAKKLRAEGFDTLRAEVRKDVRVSRHLTLVEEREHTNIYYADLREL